MSGMGRKSVDRSDHSWHATVLLLLFWITTLLSYIVVFDPDTHRYQETENMVPLLFAVLLASLLTMGTAAYILFSTLDRYRSHRVDSLGGTVAVKRDSRHCRRHSTAREDHRRGDDTGVRRRGHARPVGCTVRPPRGRRGDHRDGDQREHRPGAGAPGERPRTAAGRTAVLSPRRGLLSSEPVPRSRSVQSGVRGGPTHVETPPKAGATATPRTVQWAYPPVATSERTVAWGDTRTRQNCRPGFDRTRGTGYPTGKTATTPLNGG